jgi:subtilisin family serine protease
VSGRAAAAPALLGLLALAALLAPKPLGGQAVGPDDPFYRTRGSWGQAHDDQWGLKRIGFGPPGREPSAWELASQARHPVVVAVIDSGLDFFHPDLRRESVWRNPREVPNGRDDDEDGRADDLIGWNFVSNDNNPWDNAGHGTLVAGIIGAATGNGEGVAGINPWARIMPLKVLDAAGRGRTTGLAEAIAYAIRHGARVINLSVGGAGLSGAERQAIDAAHRRGLVVVVAAGNAGDDTADYGPAGLGQVITVAATDPQDRSLEFSNHGVAVKLAAPGVDILSLRARRTDFVLGFPGYTPRAHVVGPGGRYYRASGTSFAAPFVAGVASLLLARNPALTNVQVERMLVMSAEDVGPPGWDRFTGAGRLDARRALAADPDWFLQARLAAVEPADAPGGPVLRVMGGVAGTHLRGYTIEVGRGPAPTRWTEVGRGGRAVEHGLHGLVPARAIRESGTWTVRVVARDARGTRESRTTLAIE